MKKQNGITLIALIITIIVMLILVGVSVSVALNGGLFNTAKQATGETQIELEKEQLLSIAMGAIGTDGKVDLNELDTDIAADGTFEGTDGTYTNKKSGNTYTVDTNGKITLVEDKEVEDEGLTALETYILGADGTGRVLIGENGIIDTSTVKFIDDPETEEDETQTLGVEILATGNNVDWTKATIYVKSANKAYKITCDQAYNSEKLELIYEPKGTEGQTTAEGWTILYDNGTTAEAISPKVMGSLTLGANDSIVNWTDETVIAEADMDNDEELSDVEKSIYSYNNAITTINDYCKTLEGLPTNSGVRSVGASAETTTDKYSSTDLETWNKAYNGVGLKGDMNYEQDLIRIMYWGVNSVDSNYWFASRLCKAQSNSVSFAINYTSGYGAGYSSLWYVNNSGEVYGSSATATVRPIITIENL